jgi:Holliday junction resolvase RusA-like endonuclease
VQKKITLNITPVSAIRTVQGDRIFFRIPRDKLRPAGLARLLRIERYNNYKVSLLALAKQQRFTPAEQGMHITFYLPVPASWRKHKKERMHMILHGNRPDWDNLAKGFFDGLLAEDSKIADVRVTKKWVNQDHGYIEVVFGIPDYGSKDNLM